MNGGVRFLEDFPDFFCTTSLTFNLDVVYLHWIEKPLTENTMSNEPYETIKFPDGSQLEIHTDPDPDSPRNWDNLGTMVCFHKGYQLGDKHDYKADDYNGWDELAEAIQKDHPCCVILPLYLYDHSGITISTGSFNCDWDSGQIGFIFISRKKIGEEYNDHGGRSDDQIREYLCNEVATYDQYLTGDIWGFIYREPPCTKCGGPGEESDSCWGFFGEDPMENGMVDHFSDEVREKFEAVIGAKA